MFLLRSCLQYEKKSVAPCGGHETREIRSSRAFSCNCGTGIGNPVKFAAPMVSLALIFAFSMPPLFAQERVQQTYTLQAGSTRAVARVVDSETVLLDDGREVRLIGALAPRSPNLRAGSRPWPPECAAITVLNDVVLGRSVELAFSGRRSDRHGRLLAHLFVERDGELVWVQGTLLSSGHARAYGLPGNLACMRELLAHESVARAADAGLLSNAAYATRPAIRSRALLRLRNSYQLVEGRVVNVVTTKAWTYLDFDRDWRTDNEQQPA